MHQSQHTVENEMRKENMSLPRVVGLPEDLQHAHNYETKIVNESNAGAAAIVTPARE